MKSYYKLIDDIIGNIIRKNEKAKIFIISDHGFGELNKFININTWLLNNGYIKIKNDFINRIKYILYRLNITPENIYKLTSRFKILNIRNKYDKNKTYKLLSSLFLSFYGCARPH